MFKKVAVISSILFILAVFSSNVWAEENTVYWDGEGTTNSWTEEKNWSGNEIPKKGNDVIFDGRCTKNAEISEEVSYMTIKSLTIESDYTGTVIANSPEYFKINGALCINGGNVLWREQKSGGVITVQDDVKINGGNVELIGSYKFNNDFTWESGSLCTKQAHFNMCVGYTRSIYTGGKRLRLKAMDINQGPSGSCRELQINGFVEITSNFNNTNLVNLHIVNNSILDLSRANSNFDTSNITIDNGSKIFIKNNNKVILESLDSLYYSTNQDINTIPLSGTIANENLNDNITIKYRIDDRGENTLINYTYDEDEQNFSKSIALMDSLEEGQHILNIWAEDDKNFYFNVENIPFYIDKTAPEGTIRRENSFLYLTASDEGGSGLSQISLPNGMDQSVSGTVYEVVYKVEKNGIYEFKINDNARNSKNVSIVLTDMSEEDEEDNEDVDENNEEIGEDGENKEENQDTSENNEQQEENQEIDDEEVNPEESSDIEESDENNEQNQETDTDKEDLEENQTVDNSEEDPDEDESMEESRDSQNEEQEVDEAEGSQDEDQEIDEGNVNEDEEQEVDEDEVNEDENQEIDETEKTEDEEQVIEESEGDQEHDQEINEDEINHNNEDSEIDNNNTQRHSTQHKASSMKSTKENITIKQYKMKIYQYLLKTFKTLFTLRIEDSPYDQIVWLFE